MKRRFSIVLFFMFLVSSQAQNVFEARIDTGRILIGEPVNILLYAEVNASDSVVWPAFADSLNGLELWEVGEVKEKIEKDKKILQQKLEATSFDSGFYIIKPIALAVEQDSFFTEPFLIQVNTVVLDEEKELYGIKAPVEAPFSWTLILIIAGCVLVFAALIVLIVKRSKNKRQWQANKTIDTRTPLEKLQERLTQIEKDQNWNKNIKLFYTQLSDAIKNYVEDEFRIAAVESTTVQLKPIIMGLNWQPQTRITIIELLEEADLVKFAKAVPDDATHQKYLAVLKQWHKEVKQIRMMKDAPNTSVND